MQQFGINNDAKQAPSSIYPGDSEDDGFPDWGIAETCLACLIPPWQPSLKCNQLLGTFCCQRAADVHHHGWPRIRYIPLRASSSVCECDPDAMWHVVRRWPSEKSHYQSAPVTCVPDYLPVPFICAAESMWVSGSVWRVLGDESICRCRFVLSWLCLGGIKNRKKVFITRLRWLKEIDWVKKNYIVFKTSTFRNHSVSNF